MLVKKMFAPTSNFDTLVGSSATLDGDFTADGQVRIDGKIKGNVKINGDLVMGETALIIGNVSASNIDMSGTIEGNVQCKDQLKLSSTAKLLGDIKVQRLSMEEGAHFHGICSMASFEKKVNKSTSTYSTADENPASKTTVPETNEGPRLRKKPIITEPQGKNTVES